MTDTPITQATEVTPARTSRKPPSGFVFLSEVLAALPKEHRSRYLMAYRAALGSDVIHAVPIVSTFDVETAAPKGKAMVRTLQEELIRGGPVFDEWHGSTVRDVRIQVAAVSGKIEVSLEDLESGAVDFEEVARVHASRFKGSAEKEKPERKSDKKKR